MIYRLDVDKLVADKNCPVEKIIAPIELTGAVMCIGYAGEFDAKCPCCGKDVSRDLIKCSESRR